jgi:hypothetical protein
MKTFIKETKMQTNQMIHFLQYSSTFERLTELQKQRHTGRTEGSNTVEIITCLNPLLTIPVI